MPKRGFSEFFNNATDKEKIKLFTKVGKLANKDQREFMSQNQKQSVEGWEEKIEELLPLKDLCCIGAGKCKDNCGEETQMKILQLLSQQQLEVVEKVKKVLPEPFGWSIDNKAEATDSAQEVGFDICLAKIKKALDLIK